MLMVLAMVLAVHDIRFLPASRSEICSAFETDTITPGDKLDVLDEFRASLSAGDRRSLDQALPRDARGGIAQCDSAEGSRASCEAAAYMPALRRTGLMPRFLASLCATKAAPTAGSPAAHEGTPGDKPMP